MRPGDVPDVVAMINRSDAADGVPMVRRAEELVAELAADGVSYDDDVRLAVVDGRIVGWAHTLLLPSRVRELRCYVFGEVDPAYRRRGVGSMLLAWATQRARQQLLGLDADLPRYLRADGYEFQTDRDELIRGAGFAPVRWFEELLRPLSDLPEVPAVPGVRLADWPAEQADDDVLAVRDASFADHWGSTPVSPQAWQHHVRGFGARPDLSLVARDAAGRIVGFCLNHRYEEDDELLGRRDGWISALGVLRGHRGRGIASALIAASLARFAGAGLTHAMISVDGDSPTGAGRLYRSLGFQRQQATVVYQIEVA